LRKWKGGGNHYMNGYTLVKINPDDFFYPMACPDGYILEHRLVMAKSLGRNLHSWEIVHHKNHKRDDNQIENLQIFSDLGHRQLTKLEAFITKLQNKIMKLELENKKLREGLTNT